MNNELVGLLDDCEEQFSKESLPQSIQRLDQWVTWGNMETVKRPTQPTAATRGASSTDPTTWGTLDEALEHVDPGIGGRGLGFVLTEDDPYLAFDVDCPDYPDGSLPDWLPPLGDLGCGSWVYRTPSGAGWRIVVKTPDGEDVVPGWWTDLSDEYEGKTREVALTFAGKYMTVTDEVREGHTAPETIDSEDLEEWLREAYIAFTGNPPQVGNPSAKGDEVATQGTAVSAEHVTDLSVYDVISPAEFPKGEQTTHPFHGSSTERNFFVDADSDGETWRCWRHGVTGHAGHLLGMDVGVISCEDVDRNLSSKEWAEIYEGARGTGYDIPDPRRDNDKGQSPHSGDSPDTPRWSSYAEIASQNSVTAANFNAVSLVLEEFNVRTDRDSGKMYVYDAESGIYSPYGQDMLEEALMDESRMGDQYNRSRASEILHQVRNQTKVPTESLGGSPSELVVANGTLDWGDTPSGFPRLRDHSPKDDALSALPVEFDPDAECSRWREFVADVVEQDMEDIVQEYVGYCLLTNDLPFHKALMLVGDGANGKSQFLGVVKRLLGEENHTAHSLQEVSESSFARAQLFRSLANIHGDLSPVALGQNSMFKTLVGGDTVTAERKYETPFQFNPTAKHLYAANQVPEVQTDDDAFFRRWLLVEFPNTFSDEDRVANIGEKIFQEEASGVLNWALEGRRRLLSQGGFTNDGTPEENRRRWQQWGGPVDQFIKDCLVVTGEDEDRIRSIDLHQYFTKYRNEEMDGGDPVNQRQLTEEMKSSLTGVSHGSFRFNGDKFRGFKGLNIVPEWRAKLSEEEG